VHVFHRVVDVEKQMVRQGLTRSRLRRLMRQVGGFAVLAVLAVACGTPGNAPPAARLADNMPPTVPREFRAAWVATVTNIDWPSRRDLTPAQQRAEIITIVERAKTLNLNALIFQVRPSADALYASDYEPWSEYLTGTQGKPPEPFYDPLQVWIEESHRRGIELHAWFNPYRARHNQAKSPTARTHISVTQPKLVKTYGNYQWMDPGEPAAAQHTLNVILDVVKRYDIDGVHIDDYFYPYPVTNGSGPNLPEVDFPDEPAWSTYLLAGGKLARADWRRQNVNELIARIYNGIKREKQWVKFGVSPFGLGKPEKRPAGISGFSQYDKLYADVELWLAKGWMDYLAPQLYWPIDQKPQAFGVLLDYWLRENTAGRHVWAGLYTSRILDSANPNPGDATKSWEPREIVDQIAMVRSRASANEKAQGQIHFSAVALTQNRKGISDQLKALSYPAPALVPASPWLALSIPGTPLLKAATDPVTRKPLVLVAPGAGELPMQYVVWTRAASGWNWRVSPVMREPSGGARWLELPADSEEGVYVVSVLDRAGNESPRVRAAFGPQGVMVSP
jgi:uncharacterized lipoprotein YddW (UPF0748 family)